MATNTTNYNLVKPAATDFYDVAVQNGNMDAIDTALKGLQDNKLGVSGGNVSITTINSKAPAYAVTPTETIINTGFASGWSGELRYRISQDGRRTAVLVVEKTTDLVTTSETIITVPALATTHPYGLGGLFCLWTASYATRVQGSAVEIKVDGSGNFKVTSVGSVTANAKAINGAVLNYF